MRRGYPTGRPGPGGLHILPSDPGRRFVIRTRSRGQLSEGPGRGPAARRAKPRRTKLRITAETPERSNPQPHLPHSGEVLSDGEGQGERTPGRLGAGLAASVAARATPERGVRPRAWPGTADRRPALADERMFGLSPVAPTISMRGSPRLTLPAAGTQRLPQIRSA